jgi:hypothetical protein
MPLNHDDGSDSDAFRIRSTHRNVAPVAVLVTPPRGAEYRQRIAHGVSRGTTRGVELAPDGAAEGREGAWFTRSRGEGLFPAGAQRRREGETWLLSLPSLQPQPSFLRTLAASRETLSTP